MPQIETDPRADVRGGSLRQGKRVRSLHAGIVRHRLFNDFVRLQDPERVGSVGVVYEARIPVDGGYQQDAQRSQDRQREGGQMFFQRFHKDNPRTG